MVGCFQSLPFGIDLSLAANKKELCSRGLGAARPHLSLGFGLACDFWVLTGTLGVLSNLHPLYDKGQLIFCDAVAIQPRALRLLEFI